MHHIEEEDLDHFITPAYTDDADYLANFQGTTWNMKWNGVNFPQKGQYLVEIEADDNAILRVDVMKLVGESSSKE